MKSFEEIDNTFLMERIYNPPEPPLSLPVWGALQLLKSEEETIRVLSPITQIAPPLYSLVAVVSDVELQLLNLQFITISEAPDLSHEIAPAGSEQQLSHEQKVN